MTEKGSGDQFRISPALLTERSVETLGSEVGEPILEGLWACGSDDEARVFFEGLTPGQRHLAAVHYAFNTGLLGDVVEVDPEELRDTIEGGYSFLLNHLPDAYDAIGAHDHARVTRGLLESLFPRGRVPDAAGERLAILDQLSRETLSARLEAAMATIASLSNAVFGSDEDDETEPDVENHWPIGMDARYIREHPEDFVWREEG